MVGCGQLRKYGLGLHVLGLYVGLFLLLAFWFASWTMRNGAPLLAVKDPIAPVIDRITSTLQSGNRVWLVGNIPFDQGLLPEIHPAPHNPWGWREPPYSFYWGVQVTQYLSAHCRCSAVGIAPSTNWVNPFENLPVLVVTGWMQ